MKFFVKNENEANGLKWSVYKCRFESNEKDIFPDISSRKQAQNQTFTKERILIEEQFSFY